MGNRIAKFDGEETWVVYQSVTGSAFSPLFYDELSAWLYAHHWENIPTTHKDWHNQHLVGGDVQRFIRLSYGDSDHFDEGDVYLDECADVTAGTKRGNGILSELWEAWYNWRKNPAEPPPVRQAVTDGD